MEFKLSRKEIREVKEIKERKDLDKSRGGGRVSRC